MSRAGGVGGVFGFVERHPHVGLGGEIVDLVGLDFGEQRHQPAPSLRSP